uniref:Uncharacterized protein n=1 Tax=Oryza brachyantha TaxID=4533 RepID=J3L4X4_ORYBR
MCHGSGWVAMAALAAAQHSGNRGQQVAAGCNRVTDLPPCTVHGAACSIASRQTCATRRATETRRLPVHMGLESSIGNEQEHTTNSSAAEIMATGSTWAVFFGVEDDYPNTTINNPIQLIFLNP